MTGKTINAHLRTEMAPEQMEQCLLVWEQETHEQLLPRLQAKVAVKSVGCQRNDILFT